MARIKSINHVTLVVDCLKTACEFYEQQFGIERLPAFDLDFPAQFYRLNDHQQLHLTEWKDRPSFRGHVCFEIDDFNTVFRKLKKLGAIDIKPWGKVRRLPDGSMQLFARDPSDNLIEISCNAEVEVDEDIFRDELVDETGSLFKSGRNDERGSRGDDASLYHDG